MMFKTNYDRGETSYVFDCVFSSNQNKKCSFFKKQIVERVKMAASFLVFPLASSAMVTLGIIPAGVNILTGGKIKHLNEVSSGMLRCSGNILSPAFCSLLGIINPKTKYVGKRIPLVTDSVQRKFSPLKKEMDKSNNFLVSQVGRRLFYIARTVALIFSRSLDLFIGIVFATLSLITLGKFKELNSVAATGLESTEVIEDIAQGLLLIVNPNAKIY